MSDRASAVMETSAALVTLTPAAVKQVKRLRDKKGNNQLALRLGVKGGGCSGLSYVMSFEDGAEEGDSVFEVDGVTVIVDPKSAQFIGGITLDYSTANLLEGGWKFINPNAEKSCGCGTSFTPK